MIRSIIKSTTSARIRYFNQPVCFFFSLKNSIEKVKEWLTPRQKSPAELEINRAADEMSKNIGGVGGFIVGRIIKGLVKSVAKDMGKISNELEKIPRIANRVISLDDEIINIVGPSPCIEDIQQSQLMQVNNRLQFQTGCVITGHNRSVRAMISGAHNTDKTDDDDFIINQIILYEDNGDVLTVRDYHDHHKVKVINVKVSSSD